MALHFELEHKALDQQAADHLRKILRLGKMDSPLPSEVELASRLGISRPILRKALSQLAREGWLKIAKGKRTEIIHPRTATSARPLHFHLLTALSRNNVRMVDNLLVERVRHHLQEHGHILNEHFDHRLTTSRPGPLLRRMIGRNPVDCLILFASTPAMQLWAQNEKLPALVVGTTHPKAHLPSIDVDYHAIGWHAGGQFAKAGRQRIALLLPSEPIGGDLSTIDGIREYLARHPDTKVETLVIEPHPENLCSKVDKILRRSQVPDAFFCFHPVQTLTLQSHLLRRGYRIPQDVAIVSRESTPSLAALVPEPARYQRNETVLLRQILRLLTQARFGQSTQVKPVRLISKFLPGETLFG